MRLSEDVIRYMTVKQEGPLPAPRASSKGSSNPEKKDENTESQNAIESKKDSGEKKSTISTETENSETKEKAET